MKNKIIVILFIIYIFTFSILGIVFKDNKISYKISLEEKCLVKEYDKDYVVLDEQCDNIQ